MKKEFHRALMYYQPDEPFDEDSRSRPLAPLPVGCSKCSMPDLNAITSPYLLRKAAANAAGDYSIANVGNFLVKERALKVIEVVAPKSCDFYPTKLLNGAGASPWFLAVPRFRSQPRALTLKRKIASCKKCGELMERNTHLVKDWNLDFRSEHDIAKVPDWSSWDRENFWVLAVTTVRMHSLFQRIGLKGRAPCAERNELVPTPKESKWVDKQIERLSRKGLADSATKSGSAAEAEWFESWLYRKHTKKRDVDVSAIKGAPGLKLPDSFVRFAGKAGRMTFRDFEENGLEATIMPRAKIHKLDEESPDLAGPLVAFADTNCGDLFCFHFDPERSEPEVLHYNHETDSAEPYAENFVACLRRFTASTE